MIFIDNIAGFLPYAFDYILPGFAFFYMRKILFLKKETVNESVLYIVLCGAIIKTIVDFCISLFAVSVGTQWIHILYILTPVIWCFSEYFFRKSTYIYRFCSERFGISTVPNVWLRTLGIDGLTVVKIHTKSGHEILGNPEHYDDDFIVLKNYVIDDIDEPKDGSLASVPTSNIDYFETVYYDGSKVLKMNTNEHCDTTHIDAAKVNEMYVKFNSLES